jgi:hypothetical protein
MRLRVTIVFSVLLGSALSAFGQLNVTGSVSAGQITGPGTLNISLFPIGSSSSTVALGSDVRFLNATSLNGTSITTLTGVLKLTSGTPSNAAAADVIALWSGCSSGSPILSYNGTCLSAGGTGSVTSVALTTPSFFAVAGSPITSAGTLALSYATGLGTNLVLSTDASGAAGLRALTGAMLPNPTVSLKGGVISSTASSNQYATGVDTSGNVTYAQPSFSNLSGNLGSGQMPTASEVWTKYTIPYSSFSTASTAFAVNVVALTAKQMVCGLVEKTTTAFAGTNITGLTLTVGDSNGTATTYSSAPYNLLQTPSNTAFIANNVTGSASFAGGNIQANVTATTTSGANLSALAQGSVDISVCTFTLP